jgi:4'-phosphopantetheinyl transferase
VPVPPRLDSLEYQVHTWSASLDLEGASVEPLRDLLDEQERARAQRFRFEKDRNAFIVTRGVLRTLLGRYLDERPERIRFEYGPQGKPALATELLAHRLQFNVSHTDGLALFAFSFSADLGVDVEQVRAIPDLGEIARRFFSKEEVSALRRLPTCARERAFFACWTAKEAYIKGIGEGLSMPLDRFAVSLNPSEGAVRLRIRGDAPNASGWRLHRFEPCPGFVAALAVRARDFRLQRFWLPLEEVIR